MENLVTALKELPVARAPYQVTELARGSKPYLCLIPSPEIYRANCKNCGGTATSELFLLINPSGNPSEDSRLLSAYGPIRLSAKEIHGLTSGCLQTERSYLGLGNPKVGYFSELSRMGSKKKIKVNISDRKIARIIGLLGI